MNRSIVPAFLLAAACICRPLLAGDQPDPNFDLPRLNSFGPLHNDALFAPLPPGQKAAPASQSPKKQLTTAGRVLKWVGVGLMATGGLDIAATAAASASRSCGPYGFCDDTVRNELYAFGGALAGVGAALFFIGIHRTE